MELDALNEQIRKNREEDDGRTNNIASSKEDERDDPLFAKMEALEFDDEFDDDDDDESGDYDDYYDDIWDDEDGDLEE